MLSWRNYGASPVDGTDLMEPVDLKGNVLVNENKRDCSSGSLFDALLNQFGSLTNAAHLHAQPACVRFGVSPLSTCRISSMIWLRIT